MNHPQAGALPMATATRLRKIAFDNGFDLEGARQGDWLAFTSTHAPLRLWLTAVGDTLFIAGLSQLAVANALAGLGTTFTNPLPVGAVSARGTTSIAALHELVRRAYQLSRTLPNELLHTFQKKTAGLPTTTEAERLVVQRVGQDVFREGLMEYWQGRCAMTGLGVAAVLRASHIKAWAECASDSERLDVFNGLLLSANLDALFDKHLISVGDDGVVMVALVIGATDRALLGLGGVLKVTGLADGHRGYLAGHRARFAGVGATWAKICLPWRSAPTAIPLPSTIAPRLPAHPQAPDANRDAASAPAFVTLDPGERLIVVQLAERN